MGSVVLTKRAGLRFPAKPALDQTIDRIGLDPSARRKPEGWPAGMTHDTALEQFGKLPERNGTQIASQLIGDAIIAVRTALGRVGREIGDHRRRAASS